MLSLFAFKYAIFGSSFSVYRWVRYGKRYWIWYLMLPRFNPNKELKDGDTVFLAKRRGKWSWGTPVCVRGGEKTDEIITVKIQFPDGRIGHIKREKLTA